MMGMPCCRASLVPLQVTATYVLTDANQLQLDIEAIANKTTPVNLAQHTYFNLNGEASPLNVLNHELYINGWAPYC